MKIALAQIDARLGDIEGICARIEQQARLAAEQEARILCTPFPLFTGLNPGGLLESANFEHSMIRALGDLSERLADTDVTCLVPATIRYLGTPLFELFMLKDGRLIPMRSMLALRRDTDGPLAWAPPVFDVGGVRVAATFDLNRDLEELPTGCDLVISFQVDAFDASGETNTTFAAVTSGRIRDAVSKKSVWLALVAPVGAFDEVVYTGGSYVMDDIGRVVAAAPCFEEALLVQDVRHGMASPDLAECTLPDYSRQEWIWGALRLFLRDTVRASGLGKVALLLANDLPSSLLAALSVDALGPRNVIGLLVARQDASTPEQALAERERVESIRALARHLKIRLIERTADDLASRLERDASIKNVAMFDGQLNGMLLDGTAREMEALAVSPISKTDAALAAPLHATRFEGMIAPFGDVYLTTLEFLAQERNRLAATIPADAVNLRAIKQSMTEILVWMVMDNRDHPEYRERMAQVLTQLEPHEIDGVLEAHVDRGRPFEEIAGSDAHPEAVALLLMFVRRSEAARRMLPMSPIISARSFVERDWPRSLAWSDMGRHGDEPLSAHAIARAEIEQFQSRGAQLGERMRGQVLELMKELFGLTPEQVEELRSSEGQQRGSDDLAQFEGQVQDMIDRMSDGDGTGSSDATARPPSERISSDPSARSFPFFSEN